MWHDQIIILLKIFVNVLLSLQTTNVNGVTTTIVLVHDQASLVNFKLVT